MVTYFAKGHHITLLNNSSVADIPTNAWAFTSDEFELEFSGSSRAEPSCKGSDLDFFLCIAFLAQNIFFSCFYQLLNQKINHFKKKSIIYYNLILKSGNSLVRVQQVHKPEDLWDITFCIR